MIPTLTMIQHLRLLMPVAVLALVASCNLKPVHYPTIVAAAKDTPEISEFVAASVRIERASLFANKEGFTAFIPVNNAFRDPLAYGNRWYPFFWHHFTTGVFPLSGLRDGLVLKQMDGKPVKFSVQKGRIQVNGSRIIREIRADNGVIHLLEVDLPLDDSAPPPLAPIPSSSNTSTGNFVIGCTIYNSAFQQIRSYPGRICAFLPDGSYLSARDNPPTLSRIGPFAEVLWSWPIHVHHQLKVTRDGRLVMVPSAEIHDEKPCRTRYDTFLLLDLKTGKQLRRWSSYEHLRDLRSLVKEIPSYETDPRQRSGLDFVCELTHFNSIDEIPENPSSKIIPALSKGNFLIGLNKLGHFGVLDRDLNGPIWTRATSSALQAYHDAQVLPSGDILVYNNQGVAGHERDGMGSLSLQRVDPVTGSVIWQFPKKGAPELFTLPSGGVQFVSGTFLFNRNTDAAGGVAYRIDADGTALWSRANPEKHGDGKPRVFQDIKQLDLARFLEANRL